jgi:hypothetical protein
MVARSLVGTAATARVLLFGRGTPMPDDPVRFRVGLRGDVDLDTYRAAASALPSLLKDIEAGITGEKPRVDWKILDEADIGVMATPNGVRAETLHQIVTDARAGFERVLRAQGGEVDWPQAFGATAKNAVKRIVRTLRRVSSISVDIGDNRPPLLIQNVKLLEEYGRKEPRPEYGSIEGILDLVSVRGNLHFSVEDRITGRRISCTIGRHLLQAAKDALEKRVVVEGLIHSKNGRPTSITDVSSIWQRPEPKRSLEELVGSHPDFTGGQDSADYVRRLREGDDDKQ